MKNCRRAQKNRLLKMFGLLPVIYYIYRDGWLNYFFFHWGVLVAKYGNRMGGY